MKNAMILAAGRGERLKPLTDTVPKPLVEIAGKPLIEHHLAWLVGIGIEQVVINVHHLGDVIIDALGDGSRFGLRIHYSRESTVLETGGGIVNALPLLGSEPFVLLNGDIYTDFPLDQLPDGLPDNAGMHIVLTPTPDFRLRGDFEFNGHKITARGNDYVYCCIAIVDPSVFDGQTLRSFSLREILFSLIAEGRLSGQQWLGYWTDIGTLEQLHALRERLAAGAIRVDS